MINTESKEQCPECKGERGYMWQLSHYWEPVEDYREEWVNCSECKGTGEVSELKLAVYKARGGSAPTQKQGFG